MFSIVHESIELREKAARPPALNGAQHAYTFGLERDSEGSVSLLFLFANTHSVLRDSAV